MRNDTEELAEQYRRALAAGVSGELSWYLIRFQGRWGYHEREQPLYAPCRLCEHELRVDRLDLVLEHLLHHHAAEPEPDSDD